MKRRSVKNSYVLVIPIISFLLLLLAIGLLIFQLSKAPKEVKAVAGTLEIGGSIGKGNFPGGIWNTSGNVGIGTTAPNDKLEISGNLRFTGANPYITASSYFIAPGGAYFNSGTVYTEAQIRARGGIADDGGVLELNDDVNIGAGDLYVVNSSGNVGIGTTTPGGKLEVVGNTILDMYVKLRDYDDDTLNTELISRDSSWMFWNGGIVAGQYANGAVPSGFGGTGTLLTMGQTALAVSSGNVGIGTTAPNSTLHVVGIVNATQGFAYGLSAARPAAKEGVVWWNVSAGFHCPQWYNSTHWICNTGAATRADPV